MSALTCHSVQRVVSKNPHFPQAYRLKGPKRTRLTKDFAPKRQKTTTNTRGPAAHTLAQTPKANPTVAGEQQHSPTPDSTSCDNKEPRRGSRTAKIAVSTTATSYQVLNSSYVNWGVRGKYTNV